MRRRLPVFHLSRLFPNIVTIAGLCCGLSAIRQAVEGRYEVAVTLLVVAGILDGADGRIARFLNSTSVFGAHLDSLSDFLCFGVSPVIVLYMWKLHYVHEFGWAAALFYAVCCALRLARFNTNLLNEDQKPWQKKFFVGVPAPAGALLALMPIALSFYATSSILSDPEVCIIWLVMVAGLMASRVPTFAAKKLVIHHEWVLPIMLACGVAIALFLMEPWVMFTVVGLAYLLLIPIGVIRYRKLAKAEK